MRTSAWIWISGVLALSACGGADGGGGGIRVMRDGHADQSFGELTCTVTQPDPSMELRLVDCVTGDPDSDGFELVALFQASLADLPEGTRLDLGPDFAVTGVSGARGGSFWGASGDPSWWTGDLSLTIGQDGAATFDGTIETSDVVEAMMLNPITIDFAAAQVTLE